MLLWANRPHDTVMSPWLALPLVAGFSVLVPGIIAVAALIRGEIASHHQTAAEEAQASAELRQQLAALAAQLQAALADGIALRQQLTQAQHTQAEHDAQTAQLRQAAQHTDDERHMLRQQLQELRQQLTQAQQETTQARQAALMVRQLLTQMQQKALTDDAPTIAVAGRRYTTRELASTFGVSEATVRRRLADTSKDTQP